MPAQRDLERKRSERAAAHRASAADRDVVSLRARIDQAATALVVVPGEPLRRDLGRMLADGGYQCILSVGVTAAGRALDSASIDVVVVELDDTDTAAHRLVDVVLRAYDGTAVVAVGPAGASHLVEQLLVKGLHGYVPRPVDGGALLAAVATALRVRGDGARGTIPQRAALVTPVAVADIDLTEHHRAALEEGGTGLRAAVSASISARPDVDRLTGLASLEQFEATLVARWEEMTRERGTHTLLHLGLDRLRQVHTKYGPAIGDALTVAVAWRLASLLDPSDLLARDGDGFLVLRSHSASESASAVATLVPAALEHPIVIGDIEFYVSASVGVVPVPGTASGADSALEDARAALARASALGGNRREVVDERLKARVNARVALAADLRRALDRHELSVVYQPLVTLNLGHVADNEALVRWNHPERGTVAPELFIGLAEETGLITAIGGFVLDEACRAAASWTVPDALGDLPGVSVNLSPHQLASATLVESVAGALERTGLDPARLCLEITESALVEDAAAALSALESLRSLGVRLAIDDFGTGYSSLNYLTRLPVDVLKIDRSFTARLAWSSPDARIVAHIIQLAHSLGLQVVAEGVETSAQLAVLRAYDCDAVQGFLVGRPATWDRAMRARSVTPA